MKVDVVMPFHRNDHLLEQAIRSILNSVGVEIRLILVDDRDSSKKSSLNIDGNFLLIETGGVGFPRALRAGLDLVSAPFFAFQDSDDLTNPTRLCLQTMDLVKGNFDISICGLFRINKEGYPNLLQPPLFRDSKLLQVSNLLGSINSNSSWVCRNSMLAFQGFMSPEYLAIDWATTLTLDKSVRARIIPKRHYRYRYHKSQLTNNREYKANSFKQIYPLWQKLNSELNLPYLSLEEAACVAAPWTVNVPARNFPVNWVHEFLKLSLVSSSQDYLRIRQLIFRRIMQNGNLDTKHKFLALTHALL